MLAPAPLSQQVELNNGDWRSRDEVVERSRNDISISNPGRKYKLNPIIVIVITPLSHAGVPCGQSISALNFVQEVYFHFNRHGESN